MATTARRLRWAATTMTLWLTLKAVMATKTKCPLCPTSSTTTMHAPVTPARHPDEFSPLYATGEATDALTHTPVRRRRPAAHMTLGRAPTHEPTSCLAPPPTFREAMHEGPRAEPTLSDALAGVESSKRETLALVDEVATKAAIERLDARTAVFKAATTSQAVRFAQQSYPLSPTAPLLTLCLHEEPPPKQKDGRAREAHRGPRSPPRDTADAATRAEHGRPTVPRQVDRANQHRQPRSAHTTAARSNDYLLAAGDWIFATVDGGGTRTMTARGDATMGRSRRVQRQLAMVLRHATEITHEHPLARRRPWTMRRPR